MANQIPQELSFVDTAPSKVAGSIVCPTPASAVFNVLKDNSRWPEWVGAGVTSVLTTSSPGHGVGSTRTVLFYSGLVKVEERFIGWEEPTLWAFTATDFRPKVFTKLVEKISVEPIDDHSCRINYQMGADFPALVKPIKGLVIGYFSSSVPQILKRMRDAVVKRHNAGG